MKKMSFLGLVALTLGLLSTACVDPITVAPIEEEQTVESNLCTITATLEDATKTSLSGLNVIWQAGDDIKVFNASTPNGEIYTLSSGAGTTKATFTGTALSGTGPYYAVYPATAASGYASSQITLTIPAVQTYAANSFGPGANIAWAKNDDTPESFSFKNAGGALKLTLAGDKTITKVNIYSLAEPLSGTVQFNVSTEAATQLTFSNAVSLDCGAGVALSGSGTDFYIILPKGTLASGFQVEVIDSEGMGMLKNAAAHAENTIPRSGIIAMPSINYSQDYNSYFLTSSCLEGAWAGVKTAPVNPGDKPDGGEYIDESAAGQYAIIPTSPTKGIRVQNWTAGYAITMTPSTNTPTFGSSLSIDVTAKGSTGDLISRSGLSVSVIKQTDGRSWLYDGTNKTGYIITDAMH